MRGFDRVAAVLVALVGFVGGILLAVEIAYRALGNTGHLLVPYEPVGAFVRRNAWSSTIVVVIAVLLAVVGLVLLASEVKPRRPGLLVMNSRDADVTAALPRKSVGRVAEAAVSEVSGVDAVSAKVRGRSVVLTAHTHLASADDLRSAAQDRAEQALSALNLRRTPTTTVRIQKGTS